MMPKNGYFLSRSRVALVAATMAAFIGAAACGSSQDATPAASTPLNVRVGYIIPAPGGWPLEAAIDQGIFKKKNLDVTLVQVQRDSDCLRALASGSLDACASAADSVIRVADGGADVSLVAGLTDKEPEMLVGAKGVDNVQALKGQKVAVVGPTEGSTLSLLALLAADGVKPDDVIKISVGGSSSRLAALTTGQAAATMLAAPQSLYTVADGLPKLATAGQDPSTNYGHFLAAGKNLSGDKKEAMQRLVDGLAEASDWLMDPANKDAVIREAETGVMQIKSGFGKQAYDLYVGGGSIAAHAQPSLATVDSVVGMMKTYSGFQPVHSSADYIDTSYVSK
ncbi:ABC transporter substrate-binding protein [Pseudonocardia lutea]|uniref:ABC transporter substrate-binding protein n=1 Tax=Pseudonocardia lutea TaxID=2172015 RepID=A0ABW1II16_9PSEU